MLTIKWLVNNLDLAFSTNAFCHPYHYTMPGPHIGFPIQVSTVVQQLVYCHTHLLYGRHLDQILLAALYGVCKVNGLSQARTSMYQT